MKKAIMLIGMMVCAITLQAASIDWTVGSNTWFLNDGTSKAAQGTSVYLIDGAQWATIEAAIKGGATSFTTTDAGILAVETTSNAKGYIPKSIATHGALTAGTTYNLAYLVFDTEANKYFASAMASQEAYTLGVDEALGVTFNNNHFTGATLSGGWQTAVPEPTSGMLLLLGASLLALRRKQK